MMKYLPAFAQTPRFAPLFHTQFLGAFNDNLFKTTLFVLIGFHGLGNSEWLPASQILNVAALLFILPYFLFSALAGQLASRFDKATMAQYTKVMEMAVMALASWGLLIQSVPLLLFCLFMMGTQSALFGPVKYAILPEYLHKDELLMGNGLIESGTFIAILLGQIMATMLLGISVWATLVGVMLVAVLGWIASRGMPSVAPQEPNLPIEANFIASTRTLCRETFAKPDLFTAIMGISWFWFLGSVYVTQLPTFVRTYLHGTEGVFNLMLMLFSVGIALGSVCCARLSRGELRLGLVLVGALGLLVSGSLLVYAVGGLAPISAMAELNGMVGFLSRDGAFGVVLCMFLIGFFGGFFSVPLYTWLQMASEEAFRAKAVAANNIINALFMVASAIISMILLFIFDSIVFLYALVALGNVGVMVYLYRRCVQFKMDLRRWANLNH